MDKKLEDIDSEIELEPKSPEEIGRIFDRQINVALCWFCLGFGVFVGAVLGMVVWVVL